MKRNYIVLFGLLVLQLLNGCASIGVRGDVSAKNMATIKSIGVVSFLGDEFKSTYIGGTIFNNKSHSMEVPDWEIDKVAVEKAIQEIESLGDYKAVALNADITQMDAALDVARAANLDALVVMIPSGYDNQPYFRPGYGFHRRSSIGGRKDCTYSLFVTRVFSVESGKKLGWEWSFPVSMMSGGIVCHGKGPDGVAATQQMEWRAEAKDYAEQELSQFKEDITKSVSEGVSHSLRNLGFDAQN